MDWQLELIKSLLWLGKAFFWVVLVVALSLWAITLTPFGKKFWHLTKPCLDKNNAYKAMAMIGLLIFFVLLEVKISVLNTQFYNKLYSALQDMNAKAFWFFALLNACLMAFKVIQEVVDRFIGEAFEIKWLQRLNTVLLERYLNDKNYYHLKHNTQLDNIDQRIEQDVKELISTTVELVRGIINAIMSTVEFTIILWGLSGVLMVFGIAVAKGVVFFIYIFIIVATALSVLIGKPLIKLNFDKERLHGDYRYALIRVADNAQSIAFYNGEHQEQNYLKSRFTAIIDNRWAIIKRLLGLDGFNTGVTQTAQLLPLMLQAPRFFAGEIKLGDMHQTVQSFNRLMRALSFFRLFYENFTLYQARLNRLDGFLYHLDESSQNKTQKIVKYNDNNQLILKDFSIKNAQGKTLFSPINLSLKQGDYLLIQGASGIGKTSLLQAMAGIYPFETVGQLSLPKCKSLFLPQRSYMPQGTLRQALCYPAIDACDEDIKNAMTNCHLAHYLHALDQQSDWQLILSPGELQKVAFVRILLAKPLLIFLDESTSALDEPTQTALYQLLKDKLPDAIIISIGHRSNLQDFHNKQLHLTKVVFD